MKALKFLKNAAGISLVEVMMAVSVVGGLSLTVAQLMKNTSENTKQNAAKQENVNLKGLVQNNLGIPAACKNTFNALITQANLTAMTGTGTVAVPNIRNKVGTGTILYSSATNLDPLTITTMVLTNYIAAAGTADLVINATFKKSTNNIVMVKPIKIPMNFNIDNTVPASPVLVGCSSMAVSGGEWMLGGNAGTVDGTDYIGTSDNQPLNFRVNNQKSGRIDTGGPTFFGYLAGEVSTAPYNTAIGFKSLNLATTGNYNTSVGYESQSVSTGQENSSLGLWALKANTTGNYNTAIGSISLYSNTTGQANVAVGADAMYGGASGSFNTAVGRSALTQNTGSNNIAIGYNASLQSNSSNDNVTIGTNAMQELRTGSGNIAIGTNAGTNINAGSNNIVIGHGSSTYFGIATSDKLYIDSSSTATPLIGGDFSSAGRFVTINGKLGIGTSTPGTPSSPGVATAGVTKLHVTGGKTILDQEAWVNLTLKPGYAKFWGSFPPSMMKDSMGFVNLRGCVKNVSGGGYDAFADMPVGYRSGWTSILQSCTWNVGGADNMNNIVPTCAPSVIAIQNNGPVVIYGGNFGIGKAFCMDGLRYQAP
jgi:hypothetical protein